MYVTTVDKLARDARYHMLNKNTLDVKKVRCQSEAALQIGTYVRPKTLISVEAKKLLIKNLLST